ncbi:MAG: alpha/beta hydrolase family protein, partial [Vicinamibacterales bacterium]
MLFLSGHHNTAKVVPEYQNVCQTLVRAGLIVLAQDPVGQGERLSYFEPDTNTNPVGIGTRDHDYAGAQGRFLGDTLARYMLHDAMRGIDYLISRPDVDAAKIGVTGTSGGGHADEPRDAVGPARGGGGAGDVHHEPRDVSAHRPAAGRRAD